MVLGAGAGQLGAYAAARRLGITTVACDRDRWAFCVREGLTDRFGHVSAMDFGGLLGTAQRERAAGIISPGTDGPVRVAADVAEALKLPHPLDPVAAGRATDKLEQRRAFAREGVPQPRFSEDGTGFPAGARVVVKPAAAQGQRGLAIVEPGGDVAAAAALAASDSRDGHALCEEFVEGPEITVNAFLDGGRFVPLTVTDRECALAFGVATAHLYPSLHPVADVVTAAEAACRALAITEGPTYTQVLLSADGPRVMEVAARLGGGHDAELCAAALGVDLSAAAVLAALGRPPGLVGAGARPRGRRALPHRPTRAPAARRGPRRGARPAGRRARVLLPRPRHADRAPPARPRPSRLRARDGRYARRGRGGRA